MHADPPDRLGELLADLNDAQRAVVTAQAGPVLVVAGAGSGKTTTLVRRVAWMIRNGVPPASILLLTFTRASAANMLARARALAPEARDVTGGTFHSVANGVLRELHAVFGLPAEFTILDPEDVEQALRACIVEVPYPEKGRAPKAVTVAAIVSLHANTRCTWEAAVRRRAPSYTEHVAWFEAVAQRYATWKLDRGLLDYDDLLVYFAHALANPEVGAWLRGRWRHVLVDEHQDSNALQLELVYGLGGPPGTHPPAADPPASAAAPGAEGPNIMVVGDPAQAIYGFRGSAPATMLHFRDRWPTTRVLPLEVNYRSTQPILDLVCAVDEAMSPRFERTLRAASPVSAERPALVVCSNDRTQSEEVCRRILAARDEGVELADQAVLVRSMWAARRLEAELLAHRIPYRVVGGLRIDEAAHVKDALSLARVVDNPLNEPAWSRVFGLLGGVGPAAVQRLLAHVRAAPDVTPALARLADAPFPKKTDPAPLLAAIGALGVRGPVAARLRAAIEAFEPVFRARYEGEWADRRRDLDTVAGLADEHESLTGFLAAITIDYGLDARERAGAAPKPEERPLTVSTIHSAKGLEWHSVHLPSFVAGHFPSPYAVRPDELEEELRIFYVATSRARRRLVFYRPVVGDNGYLKEESPYERLVAPFVDRQEPPVAPKPTAAAALSGVRIDMRSVLLGKG
ncbi:MAG: ATP-dependent helicase [Pseudomonadota bacterium]|nr:ATP-dependent helicase [Pseudomonadota bacterium]